MRRVSAMLGHLRFNLLLVLVAPDFPPAEFFSLTQFPTVDLDFSITDFPPHIIRGSPDFF
jgi:hypothetical protein